VNTQSEIEISRTPAMLSVLDNLRKVAQTDLHVVFIGEHATGKEWLARHLHMLSGKRNHTFHPFDCDGFPPELLERELFGSESLDSKGATMRPGIFEIADGGTLLLNNIVALPLDLQLKIARTVETHAVRRVGGDEDIQINTRVMATLTHSPSYFIGMESLRKELYYRISSIIIDVPPLRDRREDIPMLIDQFLSDLADPITKEAPRVSQDALQIFQSYTWPGNIRHLKNAVIYSSVIADGHEIKREHLPRYLVEKGAGRRTSDAIPYAM
jgi:arginine utilization regulatory protein